jgi:hypothetical protein
METAQNVYGAADGRLALRPGFDFTAHTSGFQLLSLGLFRDPDTLHWGVVGASRANDFQPTGLILRFDPDNGVTYSSTIPFGPAWSPSSSDPTVRDSIFTSGSRTYITGRQGIYVLEKLNDGNWYSRLGGMPKGLPPLLPGDVSSGGPGSATGTVGINLDPGFAWAYRTTIRMYLPDGTLHEGPPSERVVYQNTSASLANIPTLQLFIPPCTPLTSARYSVTLAVWRSAEALIATGPPSDEMYLVTEIPITTAANVDNYALQLASTTFTDVIPDAILSVPLYTNQGAGSLPVRYRAPGMSQAINFKGQPIGGRITEQARATLTIYGTGTTNGLVNFSNVQIDSINYTGLTAGISLGDEHSQTFHIATGGTNIPLNLYQTAASLARAINFYYTYGAGALLPLDLKLAAYAINDGTDVGRIILERVLPGGSSITYSGPANDIRLEGRLSPVIADYAPAEIAWAESDDPESWPLGNRQPVGNSTGRVLAMRNSRNAFFVCSDLAIYVGRGDGGSIPELQLASATERLVAPNSAAVLDDTLYGLFDGGFLSCDENGNVSERFAQPLNAYVQEEVRLLSNLAKSTVGWTDESRNLYLCAIPAAINEVACSRQYVFSTRTGVWTDWNIPHLVSAVYIPTDLNQVTAVETEARAVLYVSTIFDEGDTADGEALLTQNGMRRERISGAASDPFRDLEFQLAAPATGTFSSLTFSVADAAKVLPGDLFYHVPSGTDATLVRVSAVDYDTGVVTLLTPGVFSGSGGPIIVYNSIPAVLRFLPLTGDKATYEKDWVQVYTYLRLWDGDFCEARLDTERYPVASKTLRALAVSPTTFPPTGTGVLSAQRGADVVIHWGTNISAALAVRLGLTLVFQNAKSQFDLAAVSLQVGDETPDSTRRP